MKRKKIDEEHCFLWYNLRMKKTLFYLVLTAMLVSCSSQVDVSGQLEADKNTLVSKAKDSFIDISSYFHTSYVIDTEGGLASFVLDDVKKEYHSVRVLLTLDDTSFYFFGYTKEAYTLVPKDATADQEKGIYKGIKINFTIPEEDKDVKAYFQSEEDSFFFMTAISERI